MLAIALTIAGSDPSGGAGLQADLKTFHQFGVYGEAVVTLVTVQNTRAVSRVEVMPSYLVEEQITAVLTDIPPQAAKTGALGSAAVVEAVAAMAADFPFPLVVDPVMISKHGSRLISAEAEESLAKKLLPHCLLVTPNIPEAEALSGMSIRGEFDMEEAAKRISSLGPRAVLIKGGHLEGVPMDLLYSETGVRRYAGERVASRHTHGTGCTYSAAITAGLAQSLSLEDAVARAKRFVQAAIESAPGLGGGNGPVNHFAEVEN
ncbi:MAG: bifunctional hydroxymethylpyrimidine kinase/phosphomethylpyrimidine kinase [Bryobacteraceae bacterium]